LCFLIVFPEDFPKHFSRWRIACPFFELLAAFRINCLFHRVAHRAVRQVDEPHLVVGVKRVAAIAALDVQMPEVIAGLDVFVGQFSLKFGDDSCLIVKLLAVWHLAFRLKRPNLFQNLLDSFVSRHFVLGSRHSRSDHLTLFRITDDTHNAGAADAVLLRNDLQDLA
jgi:hypothetical protein